MRIPNVNIVVAAALFGSVVSYSSQSTDLVVLVDSDYEVPTPMSRVFVEVFDPAGATILTYDFNPDTPGLGIPFSFGVDAGGFVNERVEIVVAAANQASLLTQRRVRLGFIEGRQPLLSVFLAKACESVTCSASQTCSSGSCVDIDVDVTPLPDVEPGTELNLRQ